MNIYDRTPDFVNEQGVKWWKDSVITSYCKTPNDKGTILNATCFAIEEVNGNKTRILVSDDDNEFLAEESSLEALGAKIDILKCLKEAEGS